ncbi:MAG: glycosyltransferase family 1 protein [Proteobacteria bacterium]|nr:glycosyltransferase family 1 protein [Pseudomonadota bacterium]
MKKLNEIIDLSTAMQIALVTETYLPEVNGVAITLGRMVHGLCRRGHGIHLIRPRQHKQDVAACEQNYRETLVAGMPIPGYSGLKSGLPAKGLLLRLWQQQRPDVVHIATEGPLGWSALSAARKLNIPVSTDFHTNFHSYTRHYGIGLLQWPIAAYLRHFHNKAACTLVPTHQLQLQLEQQGYRNVKVVSRGVDTGLFNPEKRSAALRASWGADDATPVVMLVSRIAAEKNLAVALLAFEQMRIVNPQAKMVMVGDGPARAGLQKQYPDIIFAGMQTGEALAEHYASGDIFVYPSLTETYGNVTVEAMASGLATVAYDYAAARQHIIHDANGLLAPFSDTQAFIAQAKTLIADREQVQRLRQAARHTVKTLTWDHIMGQMESVLLETARTRRVKHDQPEFAAATD